jgi:hypothetical protein
VALDELLRSGNVLHVSLADTVSHVRAHYDTVFEDLAATTHLKDEQSIHAEIERRRSIRVYSPDAFTASKLREAVKLETEAGLKPSLVIIDGADFDSAEREGFEDFKRPSPRSSPRRSGSRRSARMSARCPYRSRSPGSTIS